MPALKPTAFSARITWLGLVPDRAASLRAEARTAVMARFAGVEGEAHGGLTRPSCSRVLSQHPRGTDIRNARQFSIVAAEELAEIAARMGVTRFDPGWIGASMVVEGILIALNLTRIHAAQSSQECPSVIPLGGGD